MPFQILQFQSNCIAKHQLGSLIYELSHHAQTFPSHLLPHILFISCVCVFLGLFIIIFIITNQSLSLIFTPLLNPLSHSNHFWHLLQLPCFPQRAPRMQGECSESSWPLERTSPVHRPRGTSSQRSFTPMLPPMARSASIPWRRTGRLISVLGISSWWVVTNLPKF